MRGNTIKVSDEEKACLDEAREAIFGSSSVPYGEVITALCDAYEQ